MPFRLDHTQEGIRTGSGTAVIRAFGRLDRVGDREVTRVCEAHHIGTLVGIKGNAVRLVVLAPAEVGAVYEIRPAGIELE